MMRDAIAAIGRAITLATNGTVRDARGAGVAAPREVEAGHVLGEVAPAEGAHVGEHPVAGEGGLEARIARGDGAATAVRSGAAQTVRIVWVTKRSRVSRCWGATALKTSPVSGSSW